MRALTITLLTLGVLASTGCAFGTRNAVLTYPPNLEESSDTAAVTSSIDLSSATHQTVVLKVTDDRSDKSRIGNVRNGFGMDTADVITKSDITEWVNNALTLELTNAGYQVVRSNTDNSTDVVGLNAEIRKVYCDVYMTYDADVNLMAEISSNGETRSRKHYNGEGSMGMNWAATATSYAESLSLALQNAITQILDDLRKLD